MNGREHLRSLLKAKLVLVCPKTDSFLENSLKPVAFVENDMKGSKILLLEVVQ